jgi:hypothetical protein
MFSNLKNILAPGRPIEKNRKIIRAQSRKPFTGQMRELGFPIRGNKKSINSRPQGRVPVARPHKRVPHKNNVHKPQLKNEI